MEATQSIAADAPTVVVGAKPASQPYYKSPSNIDASMIVFEKKDGRKGPAGGVKTTTFSVSMKPVVVAAPTAVEAAVLEVPAGGRGGRGGRGGPAGGRGGRGGRGLQPKLSALAIKMPA